MSESSRSSLQQHSKSVAEGLNPYTGTWDRSRAAHLVRRTCFGAIKREVDLALAGGSAEAAVGKILSDATSTPLPDPPAWYNGSSSASEIERIYDVQRRWFEAMRVTGLSEKMTLFWHNHFVIQYPSLMQKAPGAVPKLCYDYLTLIRLNALGNLKSFVRAIGTNPAMLVYLDGFVNEKGAANENYGRELLELFTMGQFDADGSPNYTEADIKEIARALTGWSVSSSGSSTFNASRHDAGSKSFLGRTGTFGYDDVVDILFETRGRQIARFICRKLYCFFVHAVPNEQIIAELADYFVSVDYDIRAVLSRLLTSEHFFQETFVASRIKSPVELLIGFMREAELTPTPSFLEDLRERLVKLNQEVLNPPNVAGWPGVNPPGSDGMPGHRAWLTTSSLPDRWATLEDFLYGEAGAPYDPVQLSEKVSDPNNVYRLPTDLAVTLLAVPLEHAGIREVTEDFAGNKDIPPPQSFLDGPAYSINLTKIMLNDVPHYYWPYFTNAKEAQETGAWSMILAFLSYLIQLPEYQLT